MSEQNIFSQYGIEVTLNESDDFLKVRETLTRIGVASKKDKTLYQSCHILHKQGRYAIIHFKELFALDGKPTDLTDNDLSRRNAIAKLLQDWGLVKVVNPTQIETPEPIFISQIKIISHKEKNEWQLVPKYNIGKKPQNS
jgi:Bacteriophage translational regulator